MKGKGYLYILLLAYNKKSVLLIQDPRSLPRRAGIIYSVLLRSLFLTLFGSSCPGRRKHPIAFKPLVPPKEIIVQEKLTTIKNINVLFVTSPRHEHS